MLGMVHGLMLSGLLACAAPQPVQIDVKIKSAAPAVQNERSIMQLTSAFANTDHVGDYRGSVAIEHVAQIGQPTQGRGFKCMALEKITVTLVHDSVLHVASDYGPDSCMHRAISQHEYEHHQIDRDILAKYAARLYDGLSLAFSGESPKLHPVADAPGEVDRLGADVAAAIQNLSSGMSEERAASQAAIDTPGSYRRLFSGCGVINH